MNKLKKISSVMLIGGALISVAQAAEKVPISDVMPAYPLSEYTEHPVNLWMILDDSGSMQGTMGYNANITYRIPPKLDGTDMPVPNWNGFYLWPFRDLVTNGGSLRWQQSNYCYGKGSNCRVWESYYKTKMKALKSSLAIAMLENKSKLEDKKVRIGYKSLKDAGSVLPVSPWSDENGTPNVKNQQDFLTWLYGLSAGGATPLREVYSSLLGDVVTASRSKSSSNNPFLVKPGISPGKNNPLETCRRSSTMLLTDGSWNNVDGATVRSYLSGKNYLKSLHQSTTLPDDMPYTIFPPFARTGGQDISTLPTIGDLAFSAWASDLDNDSSTDNMDYPTTMYKYCDASGNCEDLLYKNTDAEVNSLSVPASFVAKRGRELKPDFYWHSFNNPASWQNMTTYSIGFGLPTNGNKTPYLSINPPLTDAEAQWNATYRGYSNVFSIDNFLNNTLTQWPITTQVVDQWGQRWTITDGTVRADLATAAVAGRGLFFDAKSSDDLSQAFTRILDSVTVDPPEKGKVNRGTAGAIPAGSTNSDVSIYSGQYDPETYEGSLAKYFVYNPASGTDYTTGCWTGANLTKYVVSGKVVAPPGTMCDTPDKMASLKSPWSARSSVVYTSTIGTSSDKFAQTDIDAKVSSGSAGDAEIVNKKNMIKLSSAKKTDYPYLDYSKNLIQYVLGDHSQEAVNGGSFRNRLTRNNNPYVLGDIVRSNPVFLSEPKLGEAHPAFTRGATGFLANLKTGFDALVSSFSGHEFVIAGSNDGMLHVFDGSLSEVFSYVPHSLYQRLKLITAPNAHHSLVDGRINVKPIFASTDGKSIGTDWRYGIVSSFGPGGKGFFGFDLKTPTFTSAKVWEYSELESKTFNANNADPEQKGKSNVGNILAEPSYVLLKDGVWAAVSGNGYNSESDKAALIIVNALTGEPIQELVLEGPRNSSQAPAIPNITHVSTAIDNALPNGLGPITQASFSGKDLTVNDAASLGSIITDRVWAGDLQGNLWVFDFSDLESTCNPSTMQKCAFVASQENPTTGERDDSKPITPLIKAVDPAGIVQPITVAPYVSEHITGYGYMIQFGTGALFDRTDISNINKYYASPLNKTEITNTIYGIWDNWSPESREKGHGKALAGTPIAFGSGDYSVAGGSGSEMRQIVLGEGIVGGGNSSIIRKISDHDTARPMSWLSHKGWFIRLRQGERAWTSPKKMFGARGAEAIGYTTVYYDPNAVSNSCESKLGAPTTDVIVLGEYDATVELGSGGLIDVNRDGSLNNSDETTGSGVTAPSVTPGSHQYKNKRPVTSLTYQGLFQLSDPYIVNANVGGNNVARCPGGLVVGNTVVSGGAEESKSSAGCLSNVPSSWLELK